MEYDFELAGLRMRLRTPEPIAISQRLAPFLCEAQETTQCTISVQEVPALPTPCSDGVWNGPEYYDRTQDAMRIFHSTAPGADAFAVTILFDNASVEILVLPGYLSWFSGSSGIFNRIGMETMLLQHQGMLLHASLIDFAGQGIAFAGPSGVGKSTQAALWHQHLGAEILNGDRAVLRNTPTGWMAYGSPYAGTSGIYRRACAPLRAIVVLKQGRENVLKKLSPREALGFLYPEFSVHRWDPYFTQKILDLCTRLLEEIPVYQLECLPEESALHCLKKGLDL